MTGLEIGQPAREDDFKRAAETLGETGAFSNVQYNFQYSPEGTALDFDLTDAEQFVPARFDNLVWFTDEELLHKLHQRVPLFNGQLPASGNMADLLSDALQALLIEQHIGGRAYYLRAAHEDGPIDSVVFSVTGVDIRIRNASSNGEPATETAQLGIAASKLHGQPYLRSALRGVAEHDLLPICLQHGYLKARISDPQANVVASDDQQTQVDITFLIDPGRQYKWAGLEWTGNSVLHGDQLQPAIHGKTGEPANLVELEQDLDQVKKLYGARGYLEAHAEAVPQFDDGASSVRFQLQVHEGEVYRMGDLEILGLDSRTAARLVDDWKLRGGEVYDSSYPKRFLGEAIHDLAPTVQWQMGFYESVNEKEKTVDVTVRIDPKPSP